MRFNFYFNNFFNYYNIIIMTETIKREDLYLTKKQTILDNPGYKLSDIYYNVYNSTVDDVEITWNLGRFRTNLNNANFNGTASVFIQNNSVTENVYLHLELPADAVKVNQSLMRGWGYACIRSVNYTLGSSSVPNVNISGESFFQIVMAQCKDAEKRSEVINLGGQEYLEPTDEVIYADIPILLPFSGMCFGKKPFDTDILNSVLNIQIEFNDTDRIYGGTNLTRPTQFSAAQIITRQGRWENKSNSIKQELINDPSSMYPYPYIYAQSYPVPTQTTDANGVINFDLQSFKNGDLMGIGFSVVKNSDYDSGSTGAPNPFNYVDLLDIEIQHDGQIMYNSPGYLYKLAQMETAECPQYWNGSVINSNNEESIPINNYLFICDFSRLRSVCYHDKFYNTFRIAQNTITAQMTLPESATQYRIFATYYYNAIYEFQDGDSNLIIS